MFYFLKKIGFLPVAVALSRSKLEIALQDSGKTQEIFFSLASAWDWNSRQGGLKSLFKPSWICFMLDKKQGEEWKSLHDTLINSVVSLKSPVTYSVLC